MSNKIKNKKQLIKYADAARLLHPDMAYMWVDKLGNIKLAESMPDPCTGFWGIPASGSTITCTAKVICTLSLKNTIVQLRSIT